MLEINDDTLMVGATEFRSDMPKLIKTLHLKKVIIMNRGEPVAVIQDFQEYKKDEDWREEFEDLILGSMAKERDESSTDADFYTHEEVFEELGLKD